MYRGAKGYYKVVNNLIEESKFYVLSIKDLRKPYLLRLSCGTAFLAKKYIINKQDPIFFEVIKGDKALNRGIPFHTKPLSRANDIPVTYNYPPDCITPYQRRQFRKAHRNRVRDYYKRALILKQYNLYHNGKWYTLFAYTSSSAIKQYKKLFNLSEKVILRRMNNRVKEITSKVRFIKTYGVGLVAINGYYKSRGFKPVKREPFNKFMNRRDKAYYSVLKPKPFSLNL